ncbi:uncharacterized protein Dvar_51380 [Desulfosarcina variabilis str. Montpellier]
MEQLRALLDSKDLSIDLKEDGHKRFVLRQNYGTKIETAFGLSRQGIRWRFQRLFNDIYISTYMAIFFIESNFGTELRSRALEIAKEQIAIRKKAQKMGNMKVYRRETHMK